MDKSGEEKFRGLFDIGVLQTVTPKSIGEALTHATIRLKLYRNPRIDKIMKSGMVKQALCKEIMSAFSERLMGMNIISGWK